MKFGVCLPNFPFGVRPTREAILDVAQEAEALGFDSVWVSDHILVPKDKPRYGRLFETLTTLAYVGGATERIELGTSVLILPYRNAITVAKQAATIDALTGGRLIIGVGAGWIEGEFNNLGADFRRRGRHLDEGLAVMKALWTEDDPKIDGEFYRFSDVLFEPRPVPSPAEGPARPGGIPIWVGGHSDAGLRRAVRFGDAWHPDDLPKAQLAGYVAKLRSLSGGRDIGVSLRRTVDLRPAMATATRAVGGEAAGRWPGGSASALAGSLEEVAAEIGEVAQLGVGHFICQFEHQTQEEHVAQMRFIAREIFPRFRE
jgi:probable F420-dependent oxidoreductase